MNPIPDWLDDLSGGLGDLTAALNDWRKYAATKTVISYGKAGYAVMALPLMTYANPVDLPAIKPFPPLNEIVLLATAVSSITAVPHESPKTSYMTTSTGDIIDIGIGGIDAPPNFPP